MTINIAEISKKLKIKNKNKELSRANKDLIKLQKERDIYATDILLLKTLKTDIHKIRETIKRKELKIICIDHNIKVMESIIKITKEDLILIS